MAFVKIHASWNPLSPWKLGVLEICLNNVDNSTLVVRLDRDLKITMNQALNTNVIIRSTARISVEINNLVNCAIVQVNYSRVNHSVSRMLGKPKEKRFYSYREKLEETKFLDLFGNYLDTSDLKSIYARRDLEGEGTKGYKELNGWNG